MSRTVAYECIKCGEVFPSSQSIAGHTKIHFKHGWIKGTHQRKVFLASPALSPARHMSRLRVRDHKILARLKGRLTKEEDGVIMRLVEISREQEKQSRTDVEVMPNKNSEGTCAWNYQQRCHH
ncbi:uncharacterized protein LOC132045761 [Lycium ferocissimum]|uniref:uncharacterized protein LOC132045761 n=1 Tax=Lycium ferocissimum TaxID=112874 RepID=UPI0028162436|nr:uncharacterized protein LOC132045761 [Lycium ferocissimum]